MKRRRRKRTAFYALLTAVLAAISGYFFWQAMQTKESPVADDSTPPEAVEKMLAIAQVTAEDVVYDLGCGDGRVVIAAAKKFGCRGVGVELRAEDVELARRNVARAGLENRIEIRQGDAFTADFSDATVVALYMLPEHNVPLISKLNRLRPGSRVVSYSFGVPDADGREKSQREKNGEQRKVYLWTPPIPRMEPPR